MSTIASRLRLLREEKNLSQLEFAEIMEVNRMTINNYETDKRTPDINFAIKAADFFGVTVEYISGKSDFRDREDFERTVQNVEFLASAIEMLPKEDGRLLTSAFTKTVEIAGMTEVSDVTVWVLTKIFEIVGEMVVCHSQMEASMLQSIQALRAKGVDDETINKVLLEKPYALFAAGHRASGDLTYVMHEYTKKLVDRVGISWQAENED